MNKIRTFVAILIARDVIENLSSIQKQLKTLASDVKWVAPELFHITLKFLGDITEEQLPQIYQTLYKIAEEHNKFEMSISEIGVFPDFRKPRVVWAGVKQGRHELVLLADSVESKLEMLGFEREKREFKAHLTIGRVKDGKLHKDIIQAISELKARDMGSFRVEKIVLMKSELTRIGPNYTVLKEIDLM